MLALSSVHWCCRIGDESAKFSISCDLFLLCRLPESPNERWSIWNNRCPRLLSVSVQNCSFYRIFHYHCYVHYPDCRTHYTMAREGDTASTSLGSAVVPGVGGASSYPYTSQFGSPPNDSSSPHSDPTRIVPSSIFASASHVMTGLPQPPRQKGRPRKRKPKDIEALTANIGMQCKYCSLP